MFSLYRKCVFQLARTLDYCGRVLVVLLLILICGNVVSALLGYPIYGTFEIATFLTAGVIAFGLAYCGLNGGHITVTFITDKLKPKTKRIIQSINYLLSIIICAIIGYQCWNYALSAQSNNEVTSALYLPTAPIIFVLSASFIVLALAFLVHLLANILGVELGAQGGADEEMVEKIMHEAQEARMAEAAGGRAGDDGEVPQ